MSDHDETADEADDIEADEDDVAGHLRMTDDQLASGTTPSQVLGTGLPQEATKQRGEAG